MSFAHAVTLPAAVPIGIPAALALLAVFPPLRGWALRLAPFAALPALAAATGVVELTPSVWPWALLGTRLGLADALARTALLFTSVLWLSAGLFARADVGFRDARARAFWGYWLVTLTGNLGVLLAEDMASFYLFFTLLTFGAYGLILYARSREAARAGRVYVAMAVLGETALLGALLALASDHGNLRLADVPAAVARSGHRGLLTALFLLGFGVKAGMAPLHLWLPLAHPIAPTAASAVLSGALIKAGVLGWLRFLPLDRGRSVALGALCIGLGLLAAAGAALVGVTQKNPKTALAYSSVSQMGIVTLALGVALSTGLASRDWMLVVMAYLTHHALAKGALFLGSGVLHGARRGGASLLVLAGLVWSGLEIAGAPLTSGAQAKLSLKHVLAQALADAPWAPIDASLLASVLSGLAVGSTLLMARFWLLVTQPDWRGAEPIRPALFVSWALLLLADTLCFLFLPLELAPLALLREPKHLLSALTPVLLGIGLAFFAWRALGRRGLKLPEVPAGDLLSPLSAVLGAVQRFFARVARALAARLEPLKGLTRSELRTGTQRAYAELLRLERGLATLWVMGLVVLLWLTGMLWTLLRG